MIGTRYQHRVFRPHQAQRDRIIDALTDHAHFHDLPDLAAIPFSRRLANKLQACCQQARVVEDDHGVVRIVEGRCKSRLCPRCARFRARRLTVQLITAIRCMDSPRLITLTLAASHHPLADQIARLLDCFRRFRRSVDWKHYVQGGAYVVECSFNRATGCWHPHLHIVADGRYWPQSAMAASWERLTGDSRICDIRAVHSASDAAKYVAGYVAKTSDTQNLPEGAIPEWAHAVHGLRMCQTFGSLHGQRLAPDDDDPAPDIELVAWADDLVQAAEQGDHRASAALGAMLTTDACLPRSLTPASIADPTSADSVALSSLWQWVASRRSPTPRAYQDHTSPRTRPPAPDSQPLLLPDTSANPPPAQLVR